MGCDHEWRCDECGKLLGCRKGRRLHIRFSRGHEYLVGYPVTGICRGCQTMNEVAEPEEAAPSPATASTEAQG